MVRATPVSQSVNMPAAGKKTTLGVNKKGATAGKTPKAKRMPDGLRIAIMASQANLCKLSGQVMGVAEARKNDKRLWLEAASRIERISEKLGHIEEVLDGKGHAAAAAKPKE